MKIKNMDLINGVESLRELLNYDNIPIKLSFKLIKNAKKIDSAISDYNDAHKKLIDKYGKKDKDGNLIQDSSGNVSIDTDMAVEFTNEQRTLLQLKSDLDIETITIDELEKVSSIKPSIILALSFMFDIEV